MHNTHFVNEWGEAVVEGLDLLFLLSADSLNCGVNFQVEGGQQALVDCYSSDGSCNEAHASTETSTVASTIASTHAAAAEAVAAASSTEPCTEAWAGTHARSPDRADPGRADGNCIRWLAGVALPDGATAAATTNAVADSPGACHGACVFQLLRRRYESALWERSGVEEVAQKGESKSLCVSLCSWLTNYIHTLKGGGWGRSHFFTHIHSLTDSLSHTPYLLDRYREKVAR